LALKLAVKSVDLVPRLVTPASPVEVIPVRRALLLLLALGSLVALPATAPAAAWHPAVPAAALAPLAPIADSPIVFPARNAPHLVVGVAPGADLDAVAASLRPFTSSLTILRPVGEVALVASNASAVAALAASDPRIAFAEPDRTLSAFADPADSIDTNTGIAFDWQYDAVQAGPAIAAVGGGSSTIVAVVDTGVDMAQPDLAGRLLQGFDATGTDGTVFDNVGHGTFVAGLIAMVDGNGIGGKGIAGATSVLPVRASSTSDGSFSDTALISGITWAADHGAGVINLSLGGPADDPALDRAIDYATAKNALVVVSAGNSNTTQQQNVTEYPAAYVGGVSGGWSIGLSVAATMPNGQVGSFSTHNAEVSIAAPGASGGSCSDGVYSTIPVSTLTTEWDDSTDPCNTIFSDVLHPLLGRFAYGEGTSFSAPIVSAVAALARQANPALTPSQLADVLRRSATQTMGTGWNEYTGAGVVDAAAAVALARTYDTSGPALSFTAVPKLGGVQTDLSATDVAGAGETPSGGLTIGLEESRDGVTYGPVVLPGPLAIHQLVPATTPIFLRATACDANQNCTQQVLGSVGQLAPPAVAPPSKSHASVQLRILSRKHKKLTLRLAVGAGAKGSAIVQVEAWTGKVWRAFGRVTVPFGKSRTITERVTKNGRYKLRAHLLAGPSFLSAVSGPVSLRVR
jgi:subtilisin family serine protease